MFPTYSSLAEVPEAFREHYVMKGGKAVAEVSTDHPLVTNNATLLNEKTAAEARATKAEGDLASAGASSLPRGHVAVPKADAELLTSYKSLGTPDELTTLKTEHGTFKEEAETAKREKHAAAVGEAMGWDREKTARLVPKVFDLSQVEVREADGKKTVVAKVRGAGGALVEKPFGDVVKYTPDLSDLLPALQSNGQGGKNWPNQDAGGRAPANDIYAQIRKDAEERAKSKKDEAMPLTERKGLTVIGANS